MVKFEGFTLRQLAKVKKLKKFKKDRADVSGSKNRKKKGYCCPAK